MRNPISRYLIIPALFAALALSACSREGSTQQAEDYLNRAETYRSQGQHRAAMIEATNALNAAPDEAFPAVFMAQTYNTLGAGRRASTLLEGFLESHRQEVALTLAKAYLLQGKFLSAEETLEGYQPGSPDEERLQAIYSVDATRMRGRLDESEAGYKQLLEQYPDDLKVQLRLVENHIFREQTQEAETLLAELRERHPEAPKVYQFSGIVALQNNEMERAERFFTESLVYAPESDMMLPDRASTLEMLAETLTALGRTTESMVYTRVLAEESSDTVEAQQQMEEAIAAAEAGELDRAESILRELLADNPESQSANLMLGMVKMSQGNVEAAEPLLTKSVDVETAGTQAIRAMAMAQAQTGNLDQALTSLERSVRARPEDPTLLTIYGMMALNSENHQKRGYLSLQKALAQDPHRGGTRLALARYHFQQDEREQGMAQLRSAFSYQPADWPVTSVYVNELLSEGDLNELSQVISTLEDTAPRTRETALFSSQYRFRSGEESRAIRDLQALTQREPGYARAHGVLAQMHYEQGNTRPALNSLETLLALEPNNDQAMRAGVEFIVNGDTDLDPQTWLAELSEQVPELRANAAALRAMLYRDAGELSSAVSLVNGFEDDQNDYFRQARALMLRDRAMELAQEGDYSDARDMLMTALREFPSSRTMNMDLVRLDLAQERYQEADALVKDLKSRHPNDPEVSVLQARVVQAEHGRARAYQQLRSSWDDNPDSQMAPLLLSLARSEAPDAVPEILQAWEQVAPNSRARLLLVAEEQQRQGDESAAAEAYEALLEANPQDPVALNNLAWLLKDSQRIRAAALAEQAVQLQPDSAPILDTYGWLLHLQGDRESALEYLERAVELAPDSAEIREHLQEARAGG